MSTETVVLADVEQCWPMSTDVDRCRPMCVDCGWPYPMGVYLYGKPMPGTTGVGATVDIQRGQTS